MTSVQSTSLRPDRDGRLDRILQLVGKLDGMEELGELKLSLHRDPLPATQMVIALGAFARTALANYPGFEEADVQLAALGGVSMQNRAWGALICRLMVEVCTNNDVKADALDHLCVKYPEHASYCVPQLVVAESGVSRDLRGVLYRQLAVRAPDLAEGVWEVLKGRYGEAALPNIVKIRYFIGQMKTAPWTTSRTEPADEALYQMAKQVFQGDPTRRCRVFELLSESNKPFAIAIATAAYARDDCVELDIKLADFLLSESRELFQYLQAQYDRRTQSPMKDLAIPTQRSTEPATNLKNEMDGIRLFTAHSRSDLQDHLNSIATTKTPKVDENDVNRRPQLLKADITNSIAYIGLGLRIDDLRRPLDVNMPTDLRAAFSRFSICPENLELVGSDRSFILSAIHPEDADRYSASIEAFPSDAIEAAKEAIQALADTGVVVAAAIESHSWAGLAEEDDKAGRLILMSWAGLRQCSDETERKAFVAQVHKMLDDRKLSMP